MFCLNKPPNTYPPYPTEDWKDREWETLSSKKSLKVRKESNRMFESAPYFQWLNYFSMVICQDQKRHQLYILHHCMCVCVSTHISIPNVDKVPFHLSWVCPKSNDACGVTQIRLGDKVSTSCLFNKKRKRIRGFPCEHALKLRSFNYFGPRGMKHKGLIVKSSQKCFWSTPPPRMSVTNEGLKGVPAIKFNNLAGDWQPGWGG